MQKLSDRYLEHYGIKGMKWGVRRYENKDGTLTSEGKQRYNRLKNSVNDFRDRNASDAMKRARKEDINKLTNKELQDYNTRLNLENNFRNNTKRNDAVTKGYNWMTNSVAMTVATSVITGVAIQAGQSYLRKELGLSKK